jgi:hypothetical protein
MTYDFLGLHFQLGLQTLVEHYHFLFLKVCICLLLFIIIIIIHNSTSFHFLAIGYKMVSSFIMYITINKGFIPLLGYFIFNISL